MVRALMAPCLVLAHLVSCAKSVNQAKFQSLYRSAKSLIAALDTGVTYGEFSTLVKSFATEVSIGLDLASTDSERACVYSYEWALKSYQDSLDLWYKENRAAISSSQADEAIQARWRLARSYIKQAEQYYSGSRKLWGQ